MSFCRFHLVVSAVELDLFGALAAGPIPKADLTDRLRLNSRGIDDYLDALVGVGLLERSSAGYSNSPAAEQFLVPGKHGYLGGYALLAKKRLMPLWEDLTKALRTGDAQVDTSTGMLEGYHNADAARAYLDAMDSVNSIVAAALVEKVEWSGYSSFVDLGGSRGNLAATLARAHPHLTATCFDRPSVLPYFSDHVGQIGPADRVRFQQGDFFVDPLPPADVYIVGHILHYFDDADRHRLLSRVYEALAPNGSVIVYDRMIDDDRRSPALSFFGSLTMLLCSPGGREYVPAELFSWLTSAGFTGPEVIDVGQPDTAVIARR